MSFIRLLLESCHLFVRGLPINFCYALPSLLLLAVLASYLLNTENPDLTAGIFIGLIVVFSVANTLYIFAGTHHTLNLNLPFQFARLYKWEKTHSDFFIFIGIAFFLLTLFIWTLSELISTLLIYAEGVEQQQSTAKRDTVAFGQRTFLLFNSKLLIAVMSVAGLFTWSYLCKIGIRIPAYVSGYYLRSEEAVGLTKHYSRPIVAVSLLFIIGVSSLTETLIFVPDDDGKSESVRNIIAVVFLYFILSQFHIALWVSLYRYVTQNYTISKLVV